MNTEAAYQRFVQGVSYANFLVQSVVDAAVDLEDARLTEAILEGQSERHDVDLSRHVLIANKKLEDAQASLERYLMDSNPDLESATLRKAMARQRRIVDALQCVANRVGQSPGGDA